LAENKFLVVFVGGNAAEVFVMFSIVSVSGNFTKIELIVGTLF